MVQSKIFRMLNVYKASAGSGKTFQLVVEYLKLILNNPYNYKHILAVTFTNKATGEMKSRILEQLHQLATGENSGYLDVLQKSGNYSEQFIRQRAGQVLKNILHDYNRFSVNTIDSFTQKVIKSFNRELGISPNFTVDLDNDILLEEATDRMFANINDDKKLLKWLKDYSREKIQNNSSQRLDNDIKKMGAELFRENFQVFFSDDEESIYTRESLSSLVKELQQIKKVFENTLKKKGQEAVVRMNNSNLTAADFSGGKNRSIGTFFLKLSSGQCPNFTKTVRDSADLSEKWVTKTNKKREEIIAIAEQELRPLLIDIIAFYDQNLRQYNTALAVLKQARTLGILIDLKEEIQGLLHEKGILPLSNSNILLSKIIGQSDTPFVYEKLGTYYKHFMLDEFQDTSQLQWNNFKPLITNSLSEGHSSLIVGDEKQSIYRWRNSDWNILAEQLDNDFTPEQKKDFTLQYNWRSDKHIIDFNNHIFAAFLNVFEGELFSNIENNELHIKKFQKIYAAFQQTPGKQSARNEGFIQVNFTDNENFQEESVTRLIEQVKTLQDNNIQAKEIAILIRKNSEGTPIIDGFMKAGENPENSKYELSVLSNESLFLNASKAVLFIIHVVEFLIDPGNPVTKATLLNLWFCGLKQDRTAPQSNNEWQLNKNFETLFDSELGNKIAAAKNKIQLASLDETITHIASLFGFFKLENELPFIQTLTDKAGELKANLYNDLSNLLLWWNEKGYKTSVNVNEETNAIRLLTVHKSKGLEYKAVLIPFFNWETQSKKDVQKILWCTPLSAPFNRFPKLPVQADTTMQNSEFASYYYTEKANSYIDTLNLVYVAFTRAKSALFINSPAPKENKDGSFSGSGIEKMLLLALTKVSGEQHFRDAFDTEKLIFEYGSIQKEEPSLQDTKTTLIRSYQFSNFNERIKLRLSGEDFRIEGEKHHSERNTGNLIHEILSEIQTTEDVEVACEKAFLNGKINKKELETTKDTLLKNLQLPEVKHWFDGTLQVLNERNLLTCKQLFRPDRIMCTNDTAIVVDYKTGEKMPGKYNKQIKGYAQILKDSGFSKVEGYLWYLSDNEVLKVFES